MKASIQLTVPSIKRNILQETDQIMQQIQAEAVKKRYHQPLTLFLLVTMSEVVTVFLSILLLIISAENKRFVYLTYIVLTVVRVTIFITNSIYMMGFNKQLFKLLFLLDNVFLVEIASSITYIFLNYQSKVEYVLGAIICYPCLLFFLVGNFRIMLKKCEWARWQVVVYKLIKVAGSTYFLVYGGYIIIDGSLANTDLFLLWIFTTCGFWGEMCSVINSLDASANLATEYVLKDD